MITQCAESGTGHSCRVSEKHPTPFLSTTTTRSDLNAYLDKEEAELGITGQTIALNLGVNADMMSAELENTTEAIQEWPNLPADSDGTDSLPLTTDQLSLVTESVWQQIGHQLDAKHS